MQIQFLEARKQSNLNRDNVVKLKQQEIESLQEEINVKQNKLNEMNNRYFEVVTDKAKLKEHTKLKENLVNLKVRLRVTKEELSLFQSSYKFEYSPQKIAKELIDVADENKLNEKLQCMENKLNELRVEAELLAKELTEYSSLIADAMATYRTNVSESNADMNEIEKAKEPIYKFHNSHLPYLVKNYPTYYYLQKECIFK